MSQKTPEGLEAARKFYHQLMDEPGNLTSVQADLVRLAQDRGFDCSIEDLSQALQELWEQSSTSSRIVYSERPGF